MFYVAYGGVMYVGDAGEASPATVDGDASLGVAGENSPATVNYI